MPEAAGAPLRALIHRWWNSLWLVPALIVAACIGLAALLIQLGGWLDLDVAGRWPRLLGGGADGARSMLGAIATSMITVAGVVFSVTLVALSLTSSQYSPSVLRNFMTDRPTQVVFGGLVGIFAYCLVVLRVVRGDDSGGFLPSIAVLGGLVLALVGIAMLVYFIHHVTVSIQAPTIVGRIAGETRRAIERLFPEPLGRPAPPEQVRPAALPDRWRSVPCAGTGYINAVDVQGVLDFAARHERVVRLRHCVGDFVIEGRPLLELSGDEAPDDGAADALRHLVTIEPERSVRQDAPFGVRQVVDVAVKALSPGINDPATALVCIDHLTALLVCLAGRRIPSPFRSDGGTLRAIVAGPDFDGMLSLALSPLIEHGGGHHAVLERVLRALEILAEDSEDPCQRRALRRMLALLVLRIEIGIDAPPPREELLARARALAARLG